MTPAEITEARRLIAAAPPGPWRISRDIEEGSCVVLDAADDQVCVLLEEDEAAAEFCAAARTGWPATLDALGSYEYEEDAAMTPAEITEARRLITDSLARFQSRISTGAGDSGLSTPTGMCGGNSGDAMVLADLATRALDALEAAERERDEARAALRQANIVLTCRGNGTLAERNAAIDAAKTAVEGGT